MDLDELSLSFQPILAASLQGTPSLPYLSVWHSWLSGSSPPAAGMTLCTCYLAHLPACPLQENLNSWGQELFFVPMMTSAANTCSWSSWWDSIKILVPSIYLTQISIKFYIIIFNNLNLFPWQLGKALLVILKKESTTLRFNPLKHFTIICFCS